MHFPLEQQIEFLRGVSDATLGSVVITHSLNSPYQRFRRAIKRLLGNPPSAVYPITNAEIKTLLQGANLVEKKRLRPMPLVTEEVIIIAEHA